MKEYTKRIIVVSALLISAGSAGLVFESRIDAFLKRYDTMPRIRLLEKHSDAKDDMFLQYLLRSEREYGERERKRLGEAKAPAYEAAFATGSPLIESNNQNKDKAK